jgi:3-hydroxyisobutyrate dehydrogenase-like beta-hydroxyacid dehydrogenase
MRVGFIGLGTMGGHFATNIQKAGHELIVSDVSRQHAGKHLDAGAVWAETPKDVAEQTDVVLASLPGPPEVKQVAGNPETGLIAGMKPGQAFFDLSTNSPTVVRALHAEFAERGVHYLDAPVSGGPAGAESGKLAVWVGGDKDVFEANRAALDAMGDQVRYIGAIGAGSIAKLVHNATGYAIQTAMAEMFSVGVKAGLDATSLWEAVRQGAVGRGRPFDRLTSQFLVDKYDPPQFALRLAHKDVALAAELGRDVGVPMRVINLVLAEMTEALEARGWGSLDSRSPMRLQLERAGLDKLGGDPAYLKQVMDADKG